MYATDNLGLLSSCVNYVKCPPQLSVMASLESRLLIIIRALVVLCFTPVNTQTHTHTNRHLLTSYAISSGCWALKTLRTAALHNPCSLYIVHTPVLIFF